MPPISPADHKRLYGALLTMDRRQGTILERVIFQYNPEELTRTLKPRVIKEGSEGLSYRLSGEPKQTISCTVLVEAITAMNKGTPYGAKGVYPPLAAMEKLLYPTSTEVIQYGEDARQGKLWVVPPEQPSTVFSWGPGRMLPVVMENMTVTETFFDDSLTPIRAKVKLDMAVLSLEDAEDYDRSLLTTQLKTIEDLAEEMPQSHTDLF